MVRTWQIGYSAEMSLLVGVAIPSPDALGTGRGGIS